VKKEQGTFVWNVTKITDKTTGTGTALTTDQLTFYTILDVPKDPWDPADTTDSVPVLSPNGYTYVGTTDNKTQPWVTILEMLTAAAWCNGMTTVQQVSQKITEKANTRFNYDDWTAPRYWSSVSSSYSFFNLTSYHNQLTGAGGLAMANCIDMAWGVVSLSNLLGDNLVVKNIKTPSGVTFLTNKILPVGGTQTVATDWVTMGWGYHAVAVRNTAGNDYIYDACLMLDETTPVLPVNMLWATYKNKLTASNVNLIANLLPINTLR
ncbi:MAG: hypothetical protein LBU65_09945, partial [Planctomycetaceae bacterium]|nr:hypothetical protein [Planctomycetaceae bacterium]